MLSSRLSLSLLSRLGQCEERINNLWNLPYLIFDFWNWAEDLCFWTRTEVPLVPILSDVQESTGNWVYQVWYMLFTGTLCTGVTWEFDTSPKDDNFFDFVDCRFIGRLRSLLHWGHNVWKWPHSERGCGNTLDDAKRSDFPQHRLWTILFRLGTIANGQVVVCSSDLTEYRL